MGYMHNPDCTLTKLRTPESPRSSSCVISPYSTLPIPAQPYPLSDAPKNPRSAMGFTNSRGKRPARLHSSMMGIRLSSMNLRVVSRTSFSSSVRSESYWRKSTPRNLIAGMSESPEELVPNNPANDTGMQRPTHRIGRAPQGKHMTVAGARDAGQCPEDLKGDGHEVTKRTPRMNPS